MPTSGDIDMSRPECRDMGKKLKEYKAELARLLRQYRVADAREKERLAPVIENEQDRIRQQEDNLLDEGCYMYTGPVAIVSLVNITYLELTQSTQYYNGGGSTGTQVRPDGNMQLIESKPLLVRAYLKSDLTFTDVVYGELTVLGYNPTTHRYDIERGEVREIQPTAVSPSSSSERRDLASTLNFLVPPEMCWGRTILNVRLWVRDHQADVPGTNPSYQAASSQYAQFLRRRIPIIHCYRINLDQVITSPGPPPTTTTTNFPEPSFADCQTTMQRAVNMWPVPSFDVRDRGVLDFEGPLMTVANYNAVRELVQTLCDATSPTPAENELFLAMLPAHTYQFGGGLVVGSQLGQTLQTTVNFQQLCAHELGHWLLPGDDHVADPACINPSLPLDQIDPNYPDYTNATQRAGIGEWGVNTRTRTLFDPETADIMSYCPGVQWVSPYNYQRALQAPVLTGPSTVSADIQSPYEDKLLVALRLNRDRSVELRWALHVPGVPPQASPKGMADVWIDVYDINGSLMVSHPCHRPADRPNLGPYEDFQEVLPWNEAVDVVVVRTAGEELARWPVEARRASPPVRDFRVAETTVNEDESVIRVSWKSTDDKAALHHMLRYTPDDGQAWIPVASDVDGTEFELPSEQLRGLSMVRFQLVASTGFRTTIIETNDAVDGPAGEREVQIVQPAQGARFHTDEPVALVGATSHHFDGRADGTHAYWTSNRDGFLADGLYAVAQCLSVGTHVLRLSVVDASGAETAATCVMSVVDPTADIAAE